MLFLEVMIEILEQNQNEYYRCPECMHVYELKEMARGCEKWCRNHKGCNLEIISESVELGQIKI